MPVYNAGKYLRNALESVVNQSIGFENIELILVDDKSADNSRNIIEEYSNIYYNIKPIFLEENSGCPGIPRNVGIENATSDCIMFIDSDDEYFPEICDKLYNTIILEDADIVVCDSIETINGKVLYLESYNCDLNRFFKPIIQGIIMNIIILGNKHEIRGLLADLSDFERKNNVAVDLSIFYRFINFFVLHGNLTIATYMCLFFSRIRESNLLLNVYRKFFLNNPPKEIE